VDLATERPSEEEAVRLQRKLRLSQIFDEASIVFFSKILSDFVERQPDISSLKASSKEIVAETILELSNNTSYDFDNYNVLDCLRRVARERIDLLLQDVEEEKSSMESDKFIEDENRIGSELLARMVSIDSHARMHPDLPVSSFLLDYIPELLTVNLRKSHLDEYDQPKGGQKSLRQTAISPKAPERALGTDKPSGDKDATFPTARSPRAAPAFWSEREPGDTPVSFVQKHYGVWRDGVWDPDGLAKPDLRHDMLLYRALASYERRHPDEALNLPTKKQANDSWVDRVLSGAEAPSSQLEKDRFAAAARRRGKGGHEGPS
jgi:hypothetical protein